jgi:hypothetical protein
MIYEMAPAVAPRVAVDSARGIDCARRFQHASSIGINIGALGAGVSTPAAAAQRHRRGPRRGARRLGCLEAHMQSRGALARQPHRRVHKGVPPGRTRAAPLRLRYICACHETWFAGEQEEKGGERLTHSTTS